MKILVAFDDSPGSQAAMQDMARGGFPEQCEAKVLTIADVWLPPDPQAEAALFPDKVAGARVVAQFGQATTLGLAAADEALTCVMVRVDDAREPR